ncbi:MAG TPA: HNH endonuclease [Chitinophagales bacterium]|nr:HNH endonuclease [Chitinophagales bacterium]
MAYCLYCGKEKSKEELTQEHFLPRAIGGNLDSYNPFSINNVCERCNTLSGLFIDAPFIKGWLLNNDRATNAKKYVDITEKTILPLKYLGVISDLRFEDNVCELWLGPTGDLIYHFHQPWPDEENLPAMAGWPVGRIRKTVDKGFVFVFIRSNNPQWHPAIIYSIIAQFKDTIIYPGNFKVPPLPEFQVIPNKLKFLHEEILKLNGKTHNGTMKISIDFGIRFLCKLGLGFGYLLFGEQFVLSEGAQILRAGMWSKNRKEREDIELHGSSFFSRNNHLEELKELFPWKGGHSFILMPFGDGVGLYANFYESQSALIQIKHPTTTMNDGLVYVVAPTLKKCVGPITMGKFIGHLHRDGHVHPELGQLDDIIQKFQGWPPYEV